MTKHDRNLEIVGAGGGKGGSSKSAANTLKSNATIRIVEAISEGPIVGLVNGDQSIFFNETPAKNSDDTWNFENVTSDQRKGHPDDEHLNGHAAVETILPVQSAVTTTVGPVVRTITNANADAVRVIVAINSLFRIDKRGAAQTHSLQYTVELRPYGGDWSTVVSQDLTNEKCVSPVQMAHRIELPVGGHPWDIRVTKVTPDSNDAKIQHEMSFDSMVTLTEGRFTYPNTALVALEMDAESMGSSLPERAYHIFGLKIKVPSNYDPVARTYSGVWDGTFKVEWTNNPAWVFYDLLTNDRYGLGEHIGDQDVSGLKWTLYTIAQYCDQLIPSGYKDEAQADILEYRFTFNGVIRNRQEARKALEAITTSFRGMGYWALGQVFASADMPSDPVKLVTPANVLDGRFTYSSSAAKARHSVAIVRWNNPNDFYRPDVEVVVNEAALRKYGWREKRMDFLGCSSRGLARRYGAWALDVENTETETVEYKASFDHLDVLPGEIVSIADPRKATVRMGGRVNLHQGYDATLDVIDLDAEVAFAEGESYSIWLTKPDGGLAECPVQDILNDGQSVTIQKPGFQCETDAVFIISGTDIEPRQFRIIAIAEVEENVFQITGLFHDPTKYARIEQGVTFEPIPYSKEGVSRNVTNLSAKEISFVDEEGFPRSKVELSWTAPSGVVIQDYLVQMNTPSDVNRFITSTKNTFADIEGLRDGDYTFFITTIDRQGRLSKPESFDLTVVSTSNLSTGIVSNLLLSDANGSNEFYGRSAKIQWSNLFPQVDGGPANKENANLYDYNTVSVFHQPTNTLLRTETVRGNAYEYTFDQNTRDCAAAGLSVDAARSLRFEVSLTSKRNLNSAIASLVVSNPVPPAVIPEVDISGDQISVKIPGSAATDIRAMKVWIETNNSFDPSVTTPKFDGLGAYMSWSGNSQTTYYVRAGYRDYFDDTLNISAPISVETGSSLSEAQTAIDDITAQHNARFSGFAGDLATAFADRDGLIAANNADIAAVLADLSTNYYTAIEVDSKEDALQASIGSVTADLTTNYYTVAQVDAAMSAQQTALQASIDVAVNDLADTFPSEFSEGGRYWSESISGRTENTADTDPNVSYVETSDGKICRIDLGVTQYANNHIAPRGRLLAEVGRTYRLTTVARLVGVTNLGNGRVFNMQFRGLRGDYSNITGGGATSTKATTFTEVGTWQAFTHSYTIQDNSVWSDVRYLVPFIYRLSSYAQTGAYLEIKSILIEDITEVSEVASDLSTNYSTTAQTDAAIAAAQTALQSNIDGLSATLTSNYYTIAQVDSAISSSESTLNASINAISSNLSNNYYTSVEVDSAVAASQSALNARIDDVEEGKTGWRVILDSHIKGTDHSGSGGLVVTTGGPAHGQPGTVVIQENSGLVRDSSGITNGFVLTIPRETALQFATRRVKISVRARANPSNPATRFGIAYSTSDVGNSGYMVCDRNLSSSFEDYSFYYDVPTPNNGNDDYIGLFGDDAQSGRSTQFLYVVVEVSSEADDIPEINAIQGNITELQALDLNALSGTAFGTFLTEMNVAANGTVAGVSNFGVAIADMLGNAQASYTLRAEAGSGGALLELVAFDDAENGSGSVARIRASNILLDGSVGARSVAIGDFTNHASGCDFEDEDALPFPLGAGMSLTSSQKYGGTNSLHLQPGYGSKDFYRKIDVNPGEQFYIEAWARKDSAFNGNANVKVRFGNDLASNSHVDSLDLRPTASNSWQKRSKTITIPPGVYKIRVTFFGTATFTAGNMWVDNLIIRRKNGGELVVDGSIEGRHVAAGEISTDKMTVGGGGNLMLDSRWATGAARVGRYANGNPTLDAQHTIKIRSAGTSWAGANADTLEIRQLGTEQGSFGTYLLNPGETGNTQSGPPAGAGTWYEFHARISSHRCRGELILVFRNAAGTWLGNASVNIDLSVTGSSTDPLTWPQYWAKGQAPAGTTHVSLIVRKEGTEVGTDSYLFVHQPYFGETHEAATGPTPYSDGGMTKIDGGQLITGSVEAGMGVFSGPLKSDNFVSGQTGWQVNANGTAEFNGVVLSRQLHLATRTWTHPYQLINGSILTWINTGIRVSANDFWNGNIRSLIAIADIQGGVTVSGNFDPYNAFFGLEAFVLNGARWYGYGAGAPSHVWGQDPGTFVTPSWATGTDQRVFVGLRFHSTAGVYIPANRTLRVKVFEVT